MKKQFQDHAISKTYNAFVQGNIKQEEGEINKEIGRSKNDFRRWQAGRGTRGTLRDAVTHYEVKERIMHGNETFCYLELHPKTGRTHQIRVHMKYIQHPVVCDTLYSTKKGFSLGFKRLALHASKIEFLLPGGKKGKKMVVESPLPADFKKALKIK